MKSFFNFLFLLILAMSFSSCTTVQEVARTLWGSSTRALEDARIDALSLSYACSFDECFEAVLSVSEVPPTAGQASYTSEPERRDLTKNEDEFVVTHVSTEYQVFLKDRIRRVIIFVGIPGNVDTTEVGVFFIPLSDSKTKIEISSLSSTAKKRVFNKLNQELGAKFTSIP